MIKVSAAGRLANHLFQYAFALASATSLDTSFDFDTSELSKYFSIKKKNKLAEKIKKRLLPGKELPEIHYTNLTDPAEVTRNLKDNTLYSGYFQSEGFFREHAALVRKAYTVKPNILNSFHEKYKEQLSGEYTCIAIRQGDYKNWILGDGLNVSPLLPYSFFEDAITKLPSADKLIFISDEIDVIKKQFSSKYPQAWFNEKCTDPIEDFLLLANAKNAVISNSSFYWWACWLNKRSEKKIIVPQYWLGFRKGMEYPNSVIPEEWIQVAVKEN